MTDQLHKENSALRARVRDLEEALHASNLLADVARPYVESVSLTKYPRCRTPNGGPTELCIHDVKALFALMHAWGIARDIDPVAVQAALSAVGVVRAHVLLSDAAVSADQVNNAVIHGVRIARAVINENAAASAPTMRPAQA